MLITKKAKKFFHFVQILKFSKNSPLKLKFSHIFCLSSLCMSEEKWKKSWAIKLGLPFVLEHCETTYVPVNLVKNKLENKPRLLFSI